MLICHYSIISGSKILKKYEFIYIKLENTTGVACILSLSLQAPMHTNVSPMCIDACSISSFGIDVAKLSISIDVEILN